MWERFRTSGLAGSYLDELLAAGIEARMEFRPRRTLDPCPFLVMPVGDSEGGTLLSRTFRSLEDLAATRGRDTDGP